MALPTNSDETRHLQADDQESEEVEIAEEELIDAYVRNELSTEERKLLEKGLLNSSRLVERFHFARLLAKAALPAPQQQTSASAVASDTSVGQTDTGHIKAPWWREFFGTWFVRRPALAFGALVIFVLIGGVALFAGWMKLRDESQRLASERAVLEKERLEFERQAAADRGSTNQLNADLQIANQQLERDRKLIEVLTQSQRRNEQSQPLTIATVTSAFLFAGSTREPSGGNELIVLAGTAKVNLNLVLDTDDYPSYRATITNSQNVEIPRSGLKSRRTLYGKAVILRLPANLLPPGDYTARLSGVTSSGVVEDVHNYSFRVRVKSE